MESYDYLYSKEALNIFFFLFSNEQLNKNQKDKLKDLLCIVCMYNMKQIKKNMLVSIKTFIEPIKDVQDLDNMLSQEIPINKMYYLFPVNRALKQTEIKENYQECFLKLKSSILEADFNELQHFLEIKSYVDDIYQKIYTDKISREECKQLEEELTEDLNYLEKYIDENEIEAYRAYLKIKTEEIMPDILDDVKNVLKLKNDETTFSELLQLKDLEDKANSANKIYDGYFEKVDLGKNERKKINWFVIKEIIKQLPVLIGLYIINSMIISRGLLSDTVSLLVKSILFILLIFLSLFLISTVKYILIFILKNRFVKGKIGFVANIKKSIGRR
ncbi:MAG: hypothetical protein J6B87_03990 [Clostridia bacterium]|nr:hypothetical protein [Clostridia bacterium]